MLAGARSFVAIAEWAADADADEATLAELGAGAVVPCESTIRRTPQNLDADALDNELGAWAQARTKPSPAVRRRVTVDGRPCAGPALRVNRAGMLAALDHARGLVLGQVDVQAKTNEIPMFATLLDGIDVVGAVVTADAMHAQRAHAQYLADECGAHYMPTVKGNQPHLHAQLAAPPWRDIPVARLPLSYFAGSMPIPAGWDQRPGAYLAFGDTYDGERTEAEKRGWPVVTPAGTHLHMLAEPERVASEILVLVRRGSARSQSR